MRIPSTAEPNMMPSNPSGEEHGLAAFMICRAARESGLESDLVQVVEETGFELLRAVDVEQESIAVAKDAFAMPAPQGNCDAAGPPVAVLFAFDALPRPPRPAVRQRFPGLDNGRSYEAERRCREFVSDRLSPARDFHPVRSTLSSSGALQLIRALLPEDEHAVRETIAARKSEMKTDFEVVRDLSRFGSRSKIELIRYQGGLAVKKTYRRNCLRFMEREASFMDTFSPLRPEILPVLERGPNYLITPFIEGEPLRRSLFGRGYPRLMTLQQVRKTAELLKFLCARGYDPVDLGPHNLLVDKMGRITAIDFEFVHKCDGPVDPARSACLAGLNERFTGDRPAKARWVPKRSRAMDPWRLRWFACTGLTLDSFLNESASVQQIKRAANHPAYLTLKLTKRLWNRARRAARRQASLQLAPLQGLGLHALWEAQSFLSAVEPALSAV